MRAVSRLIAAIGAIWLAVTLAFIALQVVPGDAVLESLSTSGVSPQIIESRRQALGIDLPLIQQYGRYLLGVIRGDLGVSLQDGRLVAVVIAQQAPYTIALAFAASAITLVFGLPLGMLAAGRRNSAWPSRLILGLLISVPVLWTGTLLLTASGAASVQSGPGNLWLPALVLGLSGAGALGLVAEGAIEETRAQPFITTARAKGLRERRIFSVHVLRASAGPILVAFVLQSGFLLGGVVVTETIFNRPGLGRLLVNAALRQDTPLVLGLVVWSALLYAVLLLAAEGAARLLDPRPGQA
jgi:peptide/nickel transport system permease protein